MPKERRSRRLFLLRHQGNALPHSPATLAMSPVATTPTTLPSQGYVPPSPLVVQESPRLQSPYSDVAVIQAAVASVDIAPLSPATPVVFRENVVNTPTDASAGTPVRASAGTSEVTTAAITPPAETTDASGHATVINIGGYSYTRANISRFKATYRCSVYRRTSCGGKCELRFDSNVFTNFVPHTCYSDLVPAGEYGSIVETMKERVDEIAVTELAVTANEIWRRVNEEFYVGQERAVLYGLTRDQVTSRVFRTRRLHFGGDIHGQIEVPPLALVDGTTMNFFNFHYSYREGAAQDHCRI